MSTPSLTALTPAPGQSRGLRSITMARGDMDPRTGLLDYVVRNDAHTWIRRGGGLVAYGETARFTVTGPDRFTRAQEWWRSELAGAEVEDHLGVPGSGLIAFGSFAFSKTSPHESRLIVPRVVIGCSEGRTWLTYITDDAEAELTAESAEAALAAYLAEPAPDRVPDAADRLGPGVLSEDQYKLAVADGVQHVQAGELSKLVLARDVVAHLGGPVATAQVLRELAVRYEDCWTYAVDGLIGSTPEMLIKVENNTARARVLAGTLDRKNAPQGDPDYPNRVLAGSDKQLHEHQIAIDSLTETLQPFTSSMTSHSEPFVLQLPNVWHLASDVTAELVADERGEVPTSLALVQALHPTAAVCGTPTTVAGALIRQLEHLQRGPYAGPVGWIDAGGNGEWGIALRGAVVETPTRVRLYAGCGIVEGSQPEAELAETWSKFRPMIEALGLTGPSGSSGYQ
ncbi:isochorismate synthase [Arthrobacter agilis]|uniref:isochorismate synthase n=2 Tax=Arthrobacter agilis TaxID=37921 RepID=UPI000B35D159|nr:isochorismate synthase [Arthrobacter agilis]PPB45884.1 isochorismate synthase [Arthrobacter agilis]TPV25425.1 isochorismate synthase [Arthrobacter agilis]VDR33163.1 Isochorismate synthase dhbC [Arthrobacter agilis]